LALSFISEAIETDTVGLCRLQVESLIESDYSLVFEPAVEHDTFPHIVTGSLSAGAYCCPTLLALAQPTIQQFFVGVVARLQVRKAEIIHRAAQAALQDADLFFDSQVELGGRGVQCTVEVLLVFDPQVADRSGQTVEGDLLFDPAGEWLIHSVS
jgi:hypothetical protein